MDEMRVVGWFGSKPVREIEVGDEPVILHVLEVYGKGENDFTHQVYRIKKRDNDDT